MGKYKIKKGLITQISKGNITIFDGEKSTLYTFNETASFLFSNLKKGLEETEIVNRFIKKFDVDQKVAKNDLNILIKNLKLKKIID